VTRRRHKSGRLPPYFTFDVTMQDARDWGATARPFGPFDAVASLGSVSILLARGSKGRPARRRSIAGGRATRRRFCLDEGGGFYLQKIVFGAHMIQLVDRSEIRAPRTRSLVTSPSWDSQFPGSWLHPRPGPDRTRALPARASAWGRASRGRLDYIQTINEWGRRTGGQLRKRPAAKLQLVPRV